MQNNDAPQENAPVETPSTVPPTPAPEPTQTPSAPQPASGGTNGLAVASMVVGIVALLTGFFPVWGLLVGIAAIVMGIIAIKKSANGKGMAIAGLVTGGLGALTSAIFTTIMIIGMVGLATVSTAIDSAIDEQKKETQQQLDAKKDWGKGETAKFDQLEVKVNSVERDYKPENQFMQPRDGKEYIIVDLTVKNTGSESEYVSGMYFSVNDNGLAVGRSFMTIDGELESGDLSPDATTTGKLVYEVTKGASDLKLQSTKTLYTSDGSKELVYTLAL